MIYQAYQRYADLMDPIRSAARVTSDIFVRPWPGKVSEVLMPRVTVACEVLARTSLTHQSPDFGIKHVKVGTREVDVTE